MARGISTGLASIPDNKRGEHSIPSARVARTGYAFYIAQ